MECHNTVCHWTFSLLSPTTRLTLPSTSGYSSAVRFIGLSFEGGGRTEAAAAAAAARKTNFEGHEMDDGGGGGGGWMDGWTGGLAE